MEILSNYLKILSTNSILQFNILELSTLLVLAIISIFFRYLFAKIIIKKLSKIVKLSTNQIDDKIFLSLNKPISLLPILLFFVSVYAFGNFDNKVLNFVDNINLSLISVIVFWSLYVMVDIFSFLFNRIELLLSRGFSIWLSKSIKFFLIFLAVVSVLEVWGIKIGPVIAGLGLFGVAVALGAQDLFKNLISGILILFEKRFELGDVIELPGHTIGTVDHIGFRSTKIIQFDTTPISIPNYIFADSSVINFSHRKFRRINWIIGLEYNSSINQIKQFTDSLNKYISTNNDFIVNEEYKCFLRLEKFNDSSIDILVCCFTNTNDWNEYLLIKEHLAYEIKKIVEENKLNFAFPSQSIYIEKNN
jgi:MscS family membrane protein